MSDHVPLREFIERIIAEKETLRKSEREALAEALKLKDSAFPTIRDFNELKGRVDVIVTLFQVLTTLAVIAAGVFAYLSYVKL